MKWCMGNYKFFIMKTCPCHRPVLHCTGRPTTSHCRLPNWNIYIYIKIFHEWLNDQKPRRLSTPPFFNIPGMDARKDYLKISKLLRDNTTISKFSQILILWSYELINLIIFFNSAVWSTIRVWTTMITP